MGHFLNYDMLSSELHCSKTMHYIKVIFEGDYQARPEFSNCQLVLSNNVRWIFGGLKKISLNQSTYGTKFLPRFYDKPEITGQDFLCDFFPSDLISI